jgi:glycine/serine hydroxymethyltransferase
MRQIAKWMVAVIERVKSEKLPQGPKARRKFVKEFRRRIGTDEYLAKLKKEVSGLAKKFPVPGV